MPRPSNPGSINVGTGLAAQDSIEANALVHPTGGNDGLRVHILDPSRAHMARAIGLEDVGGYYSSDHVEGALQEIGGTLTAPSGLQNGVVAGCTFVAAGLTITLDTPSTVRIGTDRDLSGQIEVLNNNAINWLYVDPAGTLTHSTGASPPSISSPENILLWRIVTVAGVVTSQTDARFWVPNLDRKLPFTVRSSGTATDAIAESCFTSLDAAILYLQHFGSGTQQKTRLIIRGPHTISSTVTLPQDDIVFEGDENAEFITGAALTPMFDLNAKSRVSFQNILFTCDHATSVAIQETTGGNSNLLIEKCRFESGASDWTRAINVQGATGLTGVVVRNCQIAAADVGVRLTRPIQAKILDTSVTEAGAAGTIGIACGVITVALTTEGQSIVRGCVVNGFATAIVLNGLSNEASACTLTDCDLGVYVYTSSQSVAVRDCTVTLDGTTGLYGVVVDSASGTRVTGCTLFLTRAVWAAEVPVGVSVLTANDVAVADCTIAGFVNTATVAGYGMFFSGNCDRSRVRGGAISGCQYGIRSNNAASDGVVVSGVDIRDVGVGIDLAGTGAAVSDCQITLDSTTGMTGVVLSGSVSRITACSITNTRSAATYVLADNPVGIRLTGNDSVAQGNYVTSFRNNANPLLAVGCWVEGDRCSVSGGTVAGCQYAVLVDGDNVKIDSVNAITSNRCFWLNGGSAPLISNCLAEVDATVGHTGISVQLGSAGAVITGCRVICTRAVWAGETPIGIQFTDTDCKLINTYVSGFRNAGGALGYGFASTSSASGFSIDGCTFESCYNGAVVVVTGLNDWQITDSRFTSIDVAAISAAGCANIVISGNQFEAPGSSPAISLGNGTTDAVVSDNYINGNQVTTTGIQITGTDTGTTRSRRFSITGNTIKAVTTAGINLSGYVQNGTISGNQVDGFLAASPADPTATGIRVLSVATGALPRYLTFTGNTVWRCTQGISAVGTNADPVYDLTFDSNGVHHCGLAQAGATVTSFTTGGSVGIGVDQGRRITIVGNTIRKIGRLISNTDVEGFPTAGGADVNSQGIFVHNTLGATVSGNTVTDSMSTGAGTGNGIFVRQGGAGHGAGNTFTNNGVVVADNNTLWNDALAGNGAGSHGVLIVVERGTDPATAAHIMSDLTVSGNTVRLVQVSGIRVVVGTESTMTGLAVNGNSVRESSDDGITIETAGASACTLNRAVVNSNTIVECTGVGIQLTPGGVGTFAGVGVNDNGISDVDSHGIAIEPSVVAVVVGDISVCDNRLANVAVAGHGIALLNTASALTFEHFTIRGNHITNSQDAAGAAIRVTSTDIPLRDVIIAANMIGNPANVGIPSRGISVATNVSVLTAVALRRVSITDNTVLVAADHGVFVSADGLIEHLTISNNILDVDAAPGRPLFVQCDRTTSLNEAVENLIISGNTCKGGIGSRVRLVNGNRLRGVVVSNNQFGYALEGSTETGDRAGLSFSIKTINTSGSTPGISNLAVTGNTFFECEEQGLSFRFGGAGDEVIDDIVDVVLTGNTFTRCTVGAAFVGSAALRYEANGTTRNLTIANNTFGDCPGEDAISQGTVHMLFSHDTAVADEFSAENVAVLGNTINACGGCGVKVDNSSLGTLWTLSGLKVNDNQIQNQTCDAVRLGLGSFTSGRMITISNNSIDTVNSPTASDLGINIFGPTGGLNFCSILGNTIRGTGTTSGGNGVIVVDSPDVINGLNISTNILDAGGNTGGIFVEASGTAADIALNGNVVNDASVDGILMSVTGANNISTLSISGNTIVGSGNDGIQILWNGGTIDAVTVNDNSITGSADQGIQIGSLNAGTIDGMTINGNSVRDTGHDAIVVNLNTTGGTLHAVTVSGNSIHSFNTLNSTSLDGGVRMTGEIAMSVGVSDNNIKSNTEDAVGLHFNIEGAINAFNVHGNTVHLGDEADTTSMIFDTGAGATQNSMSFTGNSFKAAVNGVSFAASAFSPDRSVVAHNNERTTGPAAGNWAAFAATFTNSVTTPNQD